MSYVRPLPSASNASWQGAAAYSRLIGAADGTWFAASDNAGEGELDPVLLSAPLATASAEAAASGALAEVSILPPTADLFGGSTEAASGDVASVQIDALIAEAHVDTDATGGILAISLSSATASAAVITGAVGPLVALALLSATAGASTESPSGAGPLSPILLTPPAAAASAAILQAAEEGMPTRTSAAVRSARSAQRATAASRTWAPATRARVDPQKAVIRAH